MEENSNDPVERPSHYLATGKDGRTIELTRDVIVPFDLGWCLGNVVKYVLRAGKKRKEAALIDLRKARWYLNERIDQLETEDGKS